MIKINPCKRIVAAFALPLFLLALTGCSSPENSPAEFTPDTVVASTPKDTVTTEWLNRFKVRIHKLRYSDSVLQGKASGVERATYLLALLDSADKYDPVGDSIAGILTWYGKYYFDTLTWEQRMQQGSPFDVTQDQFECSDRYKLIWFAHLAITGGEYDHTKFPVIIKSRVQDSCISYDRRIICDDEEGKKFHDVKIHTTDYLRVKDTYTRNVSESLPGPEIDAALAAQGYRWDFNISPIADIPQAP